MLPLLSGEMLTLPVPAHPAGKTLLAKAIASNIEANFLKARPGWGGRLWGCLWCCPAQ